LLNDWLRASKVAARMRQHLLEIVVAKAGAAEVRWWQSLRRVDRDSLLAAVAKAAEECGQELRTFNRC
jgi:hypothetical protein